MTGFVLIVTIVSSFGAVDTQRIDGGYQTYPECAADGVGRIESMRPLYPDADLRWQCQRGDE